MYVGVFGNGSLISKKMQDFHQDLGSLVHMGIRTGTGHDSSTVPYSLEEAHEIRRKEGGVNGKASLRHWPCPKIYLLHPTPI